MKWFCVLLLLSFYACSFEKNERMIKIDMTDFPNTVLLSNERIKTSPLQNIEDFVIKDSLLITRNERNDSIFMVFNRKNYKCIHAFGIQGKGPGEYLMPSLVRTERNKLEIYDKMRRKLSVFSLSNLTLESEENLEIVDLPQTIFSNRDGYIYDCFHPKSREIVYWSPKKDSTKVIFDFPHLTKRYDTSVTTGFLGFNINNQLIVYAYQYLPIFIIADINGTLIKSVKLVNNDEPVILANGKIDAVNSITYFFGLRTTQSSIFLYYVGYSGENLVKDVCQKTYIQEYTWDGNPVKQYQINRFIWNFDLVEDSASISFIGIDINNDSPFIKYYEK